MISLVSSVVIESGDSIVLDLGQDTETEPPTPRSQDSASSLLSKVIKVGVSGIILFQFSSSSSSSSEMQDPHAEEEEVDDEH